MSDAARFRRFFGKLLRRREPPRRGYRRARFAAELLEDRRLLASDWPDAAGDTGTSVSDLFHEIPLSFEANVGQTDDAVRFLTRGPGHTLFLTPDEAVLQFAAHGD